MSKIGPIKLFLL